VIVAFSVITPWLTELLIPFKFIFFLTYNNLLFKKYWEQIDFLIKFTGLSVFIKAQKDDRRPFVHICNWLLAITHSAWTVESTASKHWLLWVAVVNRNVDKRNAPNKICLDFLDYKSI